MPKSARAYHLLGRNLTAARQAKGWTQEQAERSGLSLKYWQALESGHKVPRLRLSAGFARPSAQAGTSFAEDISPRDIGTLDVHRIVATDRPVGESRPMASRSPHNHSHAWTNRRMHCPIVIFSL